MEYLIKVVKAIIISVAFLACIASICSIFMIVGILVRMATGLDALLLSILVMSVGLIAFAITMIKQIEKNNNGN